MLKNLLTSIIVLILTTTSALADFTFIVPQKPGQGTSTWAAIVAAELEKTPAMNGEKIIIQFHPGARDIAGFNKFHATARFDNNTVMVSHGGNGVSYLQEDVLYDYTQYDSVCHQNLNIIVAKWNNANEDIGIAFASGSGQIPEALAIALLIGGPDKTIDEYIDIFNERVTWVNGMSGSERHLAFIRGELSATRENPAKYKSKVVPLFDQYDMTTWFHHGILDINTGIRTDDPNYLGLLFEDVFERKWGVKPSGELYDAYNMIRSWRDALQKALWVNKGNPNLERLRLACNQMVESPESMRILEERIGKYEWVIGEEGNQTVRTLHSFVTEGTLKTLIRFNTKALGLRSVYKPEMIGR